MIVIFILLYIMMAVLTITLFIIGININICTIKDYIKSKKNNTLRKDHFIEALVLTSVFICIYLMLASVQILLVMAFQQMLSY